MGRCGLGVGGLLCCDRVRMACVRFGIAVVVALPLSWFVAGGVYVIVVVFVVVTFRFDQWTFLLDFLWA